MFQKEGVFPCHEIDFLEKVTDVVAMSVEKIVRFYALEKIKKQWESSFDSIDDPIVIIDDRFNILRSNRAFAEATGENLKDIAGKKCYDVFQTKKTNIPCAGCNIKNAFATGQPVGSEVRAQSEKRFYTTWSYPVKDNDRVLSAVHFYKDISDQINYRERLVYSEKLAEIGILAGSVAHEINNPIGGIIALLQILISETKEEGRYLDDLKEMERAAQRCKQIVDNLLHFSRTSNDDEIREVEFCSVFKTLTPLIQLQIRHENIKLDIEADGAGLFVKAVFNELVQSLLNVINTSMELISKRSAPGFIKVSVKKESSMLLLEVTDNGIPVNTAGTGFGSLALFVTGKIVKGYKGSSLFEHVDGENKYRLYFPLSAGVSSDISLSENAETRP
jgi:PAS domain S-box-containing protein